MGTSYDTVTVGVNISSSGDSVLVAAISGKRIYLMDLALIVAGATTITFKDGSTGTSFGPFIMPAAMTFTLQNSGGIHQAYASAGPGNNLVLNSSSAVQISGIIRYRTA